MTTEFYVLRIHAGSVSGGGGQRVGENVQSPTHGRWPGLGTSWAMDDRPAAGSSYSLELCHRSSDIDVS